MKQNELNKILENHQHWLYEDCKRWQEMKANLNCADLSWADLRGANLNCADLSCADLRGANLNCADLNCTDLNGTDLSYANLNCANLSNADLSCADLRGANLNCADLSCTDLRGANLSYTDLNCANLSSANLHKANLRGANLNCANLSYADLSYTDLRGADLSYTDLRGANLSNSNLHDANLRGAKNVPYVPMVCPDEGTFIGFKKIENYIVELEIPSNSRRSSATTRLCRCEFAKVLSITDRNGKEIQSITNHNYSETIYEVGKMVYPDSFDENRWNEYSHGIHFFINKQEAINY